MAASHHDLRRMCAPRVVIYLHTTPASKPGIQPLGVRFQCVSLTRNRSASCRCRPAALPACAWPPARAAGWRRRSAGQGRQGQGARSGSGRSRQGLAPPVAASYTGTAPLEPAAEVAGGRQDLRRGPAGPGRGRPARQRRPGPGPPGLRPLRNCRPRRPPRRCASWRPTTPAPSRWPSRSCSAPTTTTSSATTWKNARAANHMRQSRAVLRQRRRADLRRDRLALDQDRQLRADQHADLPHRRHLAPGSRAQRARARTGDAEGRPAGAAWRSTRCRARSSPARSIASRRSWIRAAARSAWSAPSPVAACCSPGMFGRIEIDYDQRADALVVPRVGAARGRGRSGRVRGAQGDKTTRVPVKLGYLDGDWAEVRSGVKEGDQVVDRRQDRAARRHRSAGARPAGREEPAAAAETADSQALSAEAHT